MHVYFLFVFLGAKLLYERDDRVCHFRSACTLGLKCERIEMLLLNRSEVSLVIVRCNFVGYSAIKMETQFKYYGKLQ